MGISCVQIIFPPLVSEHPYFSPSPCCMPPVPPLEPPQLLQGFDEPLSGLCQATAESLPGLHRTSTEPPPSRCRSSKRPLPDCRQASDKPSPSYCKASNTPPPGPPPDLHRSSTAGLLLPLLPPQVALAADGRHDHVRAAVTLHFDSPALNLLLMDSTFMFLLQMAPYLLVKPLQCFLSGQAD